MDDRRRAQCRYEPSPVFQGKGVTRVMALNMGLEAYGVEYLMVSV